MTTVRELIECLAKKGNWDAEVVLDTRDVRTNMDYANLHSIDGIHEINSVTQGMAGCGGSQVVTINTREL